MVEKNQEKIKKELKELENIVFNVEKENKEKRKKDLKKCKSFFPITEDNLKKLEDKLKKKSFFELMVNF